MWKLANKPSSWFRKGGKGRISMSTNPCQEELRILYMVPSEEEILNKICEGLLKAKYINTRVNDLKPIAKAIRAMMLGKEQ